MERRGKFRCQIYGGSHLSKVDSLGCAAGRGKIASKVSEQDPKVVCKIHRMSVKLPMLREPRSQG